jgi:AcrR family transcriptional regulator
MGSKERIARKKEEVHNSIMETALEILHSEGMEAISMRKIADQIDYSPPIIYCYFKNKEALLLALLVHGYQQLNKVIKDAFNTSATALERLELIMNCYLDFATKNRELYILMFRLGIADPKAVIELPEATYFMEVLRKAIADYCKEIAGDGNINIEQHYFFLISLAHGMVSVNYISNQFDSEGLKLSFKKQLKGVFHDLA